MLGGASSVKGNRESQPSLASEILGLETWLSNVTRPAKVEASCSQPINQSMTWPNIFRVSYRLSHTDAHERKIVG